MLRIASAILALFAVILLSAWLPFAPLWDPDRRATQEPGANPQNETAIAVNPLNPNNAIVVTRDFRTGIRNYIDTTTDGGQTWYEQPYPMPDTTLPYGIDPAVIFRADGTAYIAGTSFNGFDRSGLLFAASTDGGLTWPRTTFATPPGAYFDDKEWFALDETGGPNQGNIYLPYVRFGNAELYFTRSTDSGNSWSPAQLISQGEHLSFNDNPQPVVLPDGTLLVIFFHDVSETEASLVATRSTDGGVTFGSNVPVLTIRKPPFYLPGENWRIYTYHSLARDPISGALVMVWHDYRNGASNGIDIVMSRSTDGGTTWSAPTRFNDDPEGVVRDQWFPALAASPDGRLSAVWLDRRDDPNNRLFHAYARVSTDGGLTWQPSQRISSVPADPNVGVPPQQGMGDYIGMAAGPGVAWASWTDPRNGNQDIYAARDIFTPQATPSATRTASATLTPVVPNTSTPTASPSSTSTRTATATATPTGDSTSTASPTATSTPCAISFSDVRATDYFYEPVRYLFCAGAISGYSDNTFRPYSNTTRGQLTKIVVLAEGWPLYAPPAPTFSDVTSDNPFYIYIETAYSRRIISGYSDGTFRWGTDVTRGQLCKIVVEAEGWAIYTPPAPTFSDVPQDHPFYAYIETAYQHGIISGYEDRTFRPYNSATRGQIAKIVYLAVTGP